jgi:hypothetical protein
MEKLNQEQQEVLLSIHQSQHEESMGHRQSIFRAFSLSMAGLMAVLAGAVAPGYMAPDLKWGVGVAVVVACVFIIRFIRQQRQESERAMQILRTIETRLGLYEKDKYVPEKSVLPEEFSKPQAIRMGLSRGDRFLVVALVMLGSSIIGVLMLLPAPRP